jgi:hypothetical protein
LKEEEIGSEAFVARDVAVLRSLLDSQRGWCWGQVETCGCGCSRLLVIVGLEVETLRARRDGQPCDCPMGITGSFSGHLVLFRQTKATSGDLLAG